MKIKDVKAIEILDSRGRPTVRCFVFLDDGTVTSSSVPSGASTGRHEAVELRDNDKKRYLGLGVLKAVGNVNGKIRKALLGKKADDPEAIDKIMIDLDGTENKSRLGANAILSVSQALIKAVAISKKKPLWKIINEYYFSNARPAFPRLMVNVINGGRHAAWNFDIQEFMVSPATNIPSKSVRIAAEIFLQIGKTLKEKKLSTLIGDEGGYSPALKSNEEIFKLIINAAKKQGYKNNQEYNLAIDAAASEFFLPTGRQSSDGKYILKKTGQKITGEQLINYYLKLRGKYSIMSFEDPFDQDDWICFTAFTKKASFNEGDGCREEKAPTARSRGALFEASTGGNEFETGPVAKKHTIKAIIIGDDLYVTNVKRIKQGIAQKATNAVLIKPNQIGTLSETAKAIKLTKKTGWSTVISHRSGETEDPFIADLSYACGADFIKTGSMSRSERLAKYNRLLEIENKCS